MTKEKDFKKVEAGMIKTTEVVEGSVSSVEIKRTTKGTNIAVKVYDENPIKAQTVATKIFNDLDKKYKMVL